MRLMGWARTVALAGGLAGLTGCAMIEAIEKDLQRSFPDESVSQQNGAVASPSESSATESGPKHTAKTERGSAPLPEPKPLSPRRLVGMTQDEARNLLGNPSAEHSDPPATVWTWRNDRCEIDVFFYMDLSDRNFRALTYEVRGARKRESVCLGALREEARRGRGAGR